MPEIEVKSWWVAVAKRSLRTAAQSMLAVLTVNTVLWEVDWKYALGIGGMSAVYSVVNSIAMPGAINDEITMPVTHR